MPTLKFQMTLCGNDGSLSKKPFYTRCKTAFLVKVGFNKEGFSITLPCSGLVVVYSAL